MAARLTSWRPPSVHMTPCKKQTQSFSLLSRLGAPGQARRAASLWSPEESAPSSRRRVAAFAFGPSLGSSGAGPDGKASRCFSPFGIERDSRSCGPEVLRPSLCMTRRCRRHPWSSRTGGSHLCSASDLSIGDTSTRSEDGASGQQGHPVLPGNI